MKITIEAETEGEKKQFPEKKVIENIFEFAVIGRYIKNKMFDDTFSHIHVTDKCILEGKLHELIARLKDGSQSTS